MSFNAGAIVSKLTLDKKSWDKSVQDVKSGQKTLGGYVQQNSAKFRKMGMAMTVAGGAIVATFGLMIKKYVAAGDQIDKMSRRTGFAAETLSELRYAAEISGANIESLEKGIKRMAKTIVDAGDGMATYIRSFDRIGVSVEELKTLNPEEQFLKIAAAIAEVEDPTIRAATAQDIFGRAGTQLLPLFAQGAEGLDALREKAHELGIVFDTEAAEKAARLADAQLTLTSALRGVTISIAENLAPALSKLAEDFADVVAKVGSWIKEHPKLTSIIAKAVLGLGALMTVLGPIVMLLPGILAILPKIGLAIKALIGPWGLLAAAIGLITAKLIEAIGTFKKFKKSLGDYLDASGKKMSGFEKTWHSLTATIQKHVYGVDIAKIATQKYAEETKKLTQEHAEHAKKVLDSIKGTKAFTVASQILTKLIGTEKIVVKELTDNVKNLGSTIKVTSEIIENDFGRAGRDMADVLDWINTSIPTTTIPAFRDLSGVLYNVQENLQDLTIEERKVGKESKKATTVVKSYWQEVSTVISDMAKKWADASVDVLGIAKHFTYQMKEFDNSYWQNAMQNAESAYGDKKDLLEKQLQDSADYYKELTKKSTDDYNKQKEWINLNISDEEQKQEMLLALEEQHQQDLNKFRIDEEQKESDLQNKLVSLEEDHQIESERIRKEEDLARDQHATDEEDRQRSLWTKVKGIFGTAVEDMLKVWLVKFVGGIVSGATTAGTAASTLAGGAATLGTALEGLVAGVASILPAIATAIASAATILAAALPEILLVGAAAIALYAGFMAVNKLLGSGGGSKAMDATNRELHHIWEEARNILNNVDNMKWNQEALKKIGWKQTTLLAQIKDSLKGGIGGGTINVDFATTNSFLKQIRGNTALIREWTKRTFETLKGKSGGWATGFEGIVTQPIRPLIGEAGPEYVSVQPLSGGKLPVSSNVTVNNYINLNGTVITDRDYTRKRLIPEMLSALEANFEKTKMKQILGIA